MNNIYDEAICKDIIATNKLECSFETKYGKPIAKFDSSEWHHVDSYQSLTKGFIRKYQNKMDWYYITIFQDACQDIEFAKEFENKINWGNASSTWRFSEALLNEFGEKINWQRLYYENHNTSTVIKNKFRWKFDKNYRLHNIAYYYGKEVEAGYEKDGVFFFNNGDCDLVENLQFPANVLTDS